MNEIRPNQPPAPNPPRFDDEIDLVDLAVALWRRKWVVIIVAVVVTALAAGYAFSRGNVAAGVVVYSSIYEVPSYSTNGENEKLVVDPKALEDIAQRVYLPRARQMITDSSKVSSEKEFEVEISTPEKGSYLIVESKGTSGESTRIEALHEALLQIVSKHAADKKDAFMARTSADSQAVQAQIQETQELVDSLRGEAGGLAEVALQLSRLKEKLSSLRLLEASLMDGEVIAIAQPSQKDEGVSSALIVALGAILGLFAGLFAALMVGFVSAARDRLHETESTED